MINILFALSLPVVMGLAYVSLLMPEKGKLHPLESLAVSYLVGCGILSLEMFLLGVLGIRLTVANITIASVIVMAYPVSRLIKTRTFDLHPYPSFKLNPLKWYEWPFLALIIARILFVAFECLIKPVIACDAFCNWSLRAKIFFYEKGLAIASHYPFGGGQAYYPLNIPLMGTWFFTALGSWDDESFKIIFALFFISLLVIFYSSIRRFSSRFISLLSTYLLTTLPFLVYHSTIEYADLPLAVYITTSFLYLINYFEYKDKKHLYISALLAGMASWTKSEGLPFMLIIVFLLGLYEYLNKRDYLSNVLTYFVLAVIFKAPWQIFNIVYRIPRSPWQALQFGKAFEYLPRIPVIFENFYNKMFFYGNWNISWFVFFIVLLLPFACLKRTRNMFSLMMVAILMSAIAFLYYITPSYVWLLDGTTLNRNTLIVMPLVIYFIAAQLSCIFHVNEKMD